MSVLYAGITPLHWVLDVAYFALIGAGMIARERRWLFAAGGLGLLAVSAVAGFAALWWLCGCAALVGLAYLALWRQKRQRGGPS